jgi:hypothetical protein
MDADMRVYGTENFDNPAQFLFQKMTELAVLYVTIGACG